MLSDASHELTVVFLPFSGEFNGVKGDGRCINTIGMCRATLNADGKVTKLELFFDAANILKKVEGTGIIYSLLVQLSKRN